MIRGFSLYLLAPSTEAVVGFLVMVPVTTYYLSTEDFGVVAIITALVAPIGPLASSGSAWVISANYYKLKKRDFGELLFNVAVFDLLLRLVWVVVYWALAQWLLDVLIEDFREEHVRYFNYVLASFLLGSFTPMVLHLLVLQERALNHCTFEFLRFTSAVLTTLVCLIWLQLGVVSLFISPLVSNLVVLPLTLWVIVRNSNARISLGRMREIVRVGLPALPTALAETLGKSGDRYFIQKFLSLSQLGIYNHAEGYTRVFNLFIRAVGNTLSPRVLRDFSNGEVELSEDNSFLIGQLLWMVLAAGVILTLMTHDVIDLLTHGKFVAAAPIVPLWFLLVFSRVYGMLYSCYLMSQKQSRVLMMSVTVPSLLFLAVTGVGVYYFGVYGAVASIISSNLAMHLWRRWSATRLGCRIHLDGRFLIALSAYLSIYLLVQIAEPVFAIRCVLALTVAVAALYYLRNTLRQLWPF